MSKSILVYNPFTSKGNLGDELFKDAFWGLFPQHRFTFSDTITEANTKTDALFIGGGSFLSFPINGFEHLSSSIPVFYIGVGAEGSDIHPHHQELMKRAKLIALRSDAGLDAVKALNSNTIQTPDIVYSLYKPEYVKTKTVSSEKSVLLLPNITCVPKYDDPAWKHNSWNHFKFEFAQFLDTLVLDGYSIQYMPMCINRENIDDYAMVEIKNLMRKGHTISDLLRYSSPNIKDLIEVFSRYGTVITQRFHGMILSEMAHTPYLSIAHHDKLKQSNFTEGYLRGQYTSYYATSKDTLLTAFNTTRSFKIEPLSISSHSYETLKSEVSKHLER